MEGALQLDEDGKEVSELQKENDAEMNSPKKRWTATNNVQIRDVWKRKSPYHLFSQLNSKRPSAVKKQQSIILSTKTYLFLVLSVQAMYA